MKKNSKNLYAIAVLDDVESREKVISDIFDINYVPVLKNQYICGSLMFVSKTDNFSIIKKWKTLSGAQKYLNNIITQIKNYPSSNFIGVSVVKQSNFRIDEITDTWNDSIDKRIKLETESFNSRIIYLKNSKII